jgi:hypothetical protein
MINCDFLARDTLEWKKKKFKQLVLNFSCSNMQKGLSYQLMFFFSPKYIMNDGSQLGLG